MKICGYENLRACSYTENLRACSYTPFYLAQLAGLFDAEGLDVDLRLSPSPPETAQGLIDGRADVSFGGPMRVMRRDRRRAGVRTL